MRTPFIAGNWKMHKGPEEAVTFLNGFAEAIGDVGDREVLICPPSVDLHVMGQKLRRLGDDAPFRLGAQNMHPAEAGAYTGEVSPPMLKAVNCDYVILGHSERRHVFGEQNDFINEKVKAARAFDLIPILCVGETEDERDAGRVEEVVSTQLRQGQIGRASCRERVCVGV